MKSQYFTEEHELFRQSVRQFIQKEIIPFGNQWEKDEKIPRDLFVKLGEQGFLGINHEEAYGGSKAATKLLRNFKNPLPKYQHMFEQPESNSTFESFKNAFKKLFLKFKLATLLY